LLGSGSEVGLLELQQFVIKERADAEKVATVYDIFDPRTQEKTGIARAKPGSNFLARFSSRKFRTTELKVHEIQDDSLVFTVRQRTGWRRRRIEVYDADDHLMGRGELRGRGAALWIYDRRNLPFAELKASLAGENCYFRAVDGRELGRVEWNTLRTESRPPVADCFVSVGDELAAQPLAKMLLLGTALAMNIAYPRGK
jgi:hypothetical protein